MKVTQWFQSINWWKVLYITLARVIPIVAIVSLVLRVCMAQFGVRDTLSVLAIIISFVATVGCLVFFYAVLVNAAEENQHLFTDPTLDQKLKAEFGEMAPEPEES